MDTYTADEELMLRFQEQGCTRAFGELFARHKDAFVDFLARLAGDRNVAEDVSQQVWLKLIDVARRGRYARTARFRTYLYTIGRNLYVDEYHRKHGHARTEPLGETAAVADGDVNREPESQAVERERIVLLERALARLPFEQREVLALWVAGTSIEAMAEVTGAPRDTVLSRRKYALKRLKSTLDEAGVVWSEL